MRENHLGKIWGGVFGNEWMERCAVTPERFAAHLSMWRDTLRRVEAVDSVCKLGANYGLNMMTLHTLLPDVELTGVEINHAAAEKLAQLPYVHAIESSLYHLSSAVYAAV